jgi:Na+-transporting NADH:ubiquinone oxidoreductase subunit C
MQGGGDMPDLNPISLWQRLLAAPNDSRGKTLTMAFLVSFAAALALSSAAVLLGPRLDANREAERRARLEALIAETPGLAEVLPGSGIDSLEVLTVDLRDLSLADAVDPAQVTELTPDDDIAGIGTRPDLQQIFMARDGRDLALVILPVYGQGYQSTIRGYLALGPDLNTVIGLTITEQGETPGLGATIQTPGWLAQWPGTQLMDEAGEIRVAVVRGGGTTSYEVDAITGATRSSNGVQNMIRFWVGPLGFGPVLDALRSGDL